MILFFDCETSGLLRDDVPAEDPSQPHLVQLGLRLCQPDGRTAGVFVALIKPDGWAVESEALAVHGIDEARAIRGGIDVRAALVALQAFTVKATTLVAHHAEFDRKVIAAQLAKLNADGAWWKRCGPRFFCTMERSAGICKLPGEYGWKFPSLEEAHRHFFPSDNYRTKHDADDDVAACAAIYWALQEMGRN